MEIMNAKDKIILVSSVSMSTILERHIPDNVQVITPERASEMGITAPRETVMPIEPMIISPYPDYFQPPITRRERRAQERKKKEK